MRKANHSEATYDTFNIPLKPYRPKTNAALRPTAFLVVFLSAAYCCGQNYSSLSPKDAFVSIVGGMLMTTST